MCLFNTGSNVEDIFSLAATAYELLLNGSCMNAGVVGVKGKSSDVSETDVVELIGVLMADAGERLGVTGNAAKG